jgi:hypothetical protein
MATSRGSGGLMDEQSTNELFGEDDAPTQWFRRPPSVAPPEAPLPRSSPRIQAAAFAGLAATEGFLQEISGPLSFVGGIVRELVAGRAVDAADRAVALEEIQRIEALAQALRDAPGTELDLTAVLVSELVTLAHGEHAPELRARGLGWHALVAPGFTVVADRLAFAFILHAMVRTALRRAVRGTDLVLRAETTLCDAKIEVQVVASAGTQLPDLRVPVWAAEGDEHLALLIARRIARAHDFRLRLDSYPDTHVLRLDIPGAAIAGGGA